MADKKPPKKTAQTASAAPKAKTPKVHEDYTPRLRQHYRENVVPKLQKEFGIENVMAVPRLDKVVINMGVGEATQNIKILDEAVEELAKISG